MPRRIDLHEGQTVEIGGICVALGVARGKRASLFLGVYDADGLLEGFDEVKRAACKQLTSLDQSPIIGKDISTGVEQSGSSQGL